MAENDSPAPGASRDSDERAIAGRAARANVKQQRAAPSRSAGHVRSGARMLVKEARKILERHRARIDADIVAQIDETVREIEQLRAQQPNEDLAELEYHAEQLDELLHQHASFARKSALRDTLENIGIAVIVALAVRSCIYEPFKIPSGSMMPTLRPGDHIFVNKFAYGVQIPLTTRVVGEDWISDIARGDVIVFRFPLDESDDFIKRVIGVPGDTVRVNGDRRKIELKRAGTDSFEDITRTKLDDVKCEADNSTQTIENCSVYQEQLDEHTYEVRYRDDLRTNDPSMRTYEVPDGFLLVMGDNRNASQDSLAWAVTGDTITAAGLLSRPDIRDITSVENDRIELHDDGDVIRSNDDGLRDRARYLAERNDPARDLTLEAWREPPIDARAVFESLAAKYGATQEVDFKTLMGSFQGAEDRVLEYGAKLGAMRFGEGEVASDLVFWGPRDDVVFRLHCGSKRCMRPADLATRAAMVIKAFEADPDYDARELLLNEYGRSKTYPGRGAYETRYVERKFGPDHEGVRLRAWRSPAEGLDVLRDAALGEYGVGPLADAMRERWDVEADADAGEVAAVPDLGPAAWTFERDGVFVVVHADAEHEMLAVLECGSKRCKSRTDAIALATDVASRFPAVAKERERLNELLGQATVGALQEVPLPKPVAYYWDHLSVAGVVLDDSHSIRIDVEQMPGGGLEEAIERRRGELAGAEPVEGLGPSAFYADTPNGHTFVFTVPETQLFVELACRPGLCPDAATARQLAERARTKGLDSENFLQKGVSKPRPFVPRGNVKGRAEVIWWPTARFWKKID